MSRSKTNDDVAVLLCAVSAAYLARNMFKELAQAQDPGAAKSEQDAALLRWHEHHHTQGAVVARLVEIDPDGARLKRCGDSLSARLQAPRKRKRKRKAPVLRLVRNERAVRAVKR